jgi:hypothetical protein
MRRTHKNKRTAICIGVGDNGVPCTNVGNCARGYCERCYHVVRDHCRRNNNSWREIVGGNEIPKPPLEPWTYENPEGEAELAAQAEKQDRESQQETSNVE